MSVKYITIDDVHAGQRLDNYLIRELKGVPKSRIYRAVRKGEVRINRKRAKADSRLEAGDELRLPPIRRPDPTAVREVSERFSQLLESRILIENNQYMMIDKPAGIPVHGGSNVALGLIEALRQMRPECKFLELVHRLDKDTSGCLLIGKKRSTLTRLQQWLVTPQMKKRYWVLVKGQWNQGEVRCDLPLRKNELEGGERIVKVSQDGKQAITIFRPLKVFDNASLLEATLKTGRTHQIRVHLQSLGYVVAGDDKYGDSEFNKSLKKIGLSRMFLHCVELGYRDHDNLFGACTLLDERLAKVLSRLT